MAVTSMAWETAGHSQCKQDKLEEIIDQTTMRNNNLMYATVTHAWITNK